MNNNLFLKSNETTKYNNRFNFLDEQYNDKLSSNEYSNKSNRKIIQYDSSQNSFIQSSKYERNRETYNNTRHNDYQNKTKTHSIQTTKKINVNDITLFPQLKLIKENNITYIEPSTKFKDMLINVINNNNPDGNHIPTGWAILSRVNGKTVIKHGDITELRIRQQKQEELCNDPNYIMFQAIETMKQRWELHEIVYDSINGEDAYAGRFRLPPVYGSEYSSEYGTDNSDTDYDDNWDDDTF